MICVANSPAVYCVEIDVPSVLETNMPFRDNGFSWSVYVLPLAEYWRHEHDKHIYIWRCHHVTSSSTRAHKALIAMTGCALVICWCKSESCSIIIFLIREEHDTKRNVLYGGTNCHKMSLPALLLPSMPSVFWYSVNYSKYMDPLKHSIIALLPTCPMKITLAQFSTYVVWPNEYSGLHA